MNAIREWSTVICLSALVAAMVQSLVPDGSMERMAKFIIGAFVVCALIQPITKAVPQMDLRNNKNQQSGANLKLESTVEEQTKKAVRKSIANLVTAHLNGMKIKCKNVHVIMDTNQNGSISINKVIVTLQKEYAADCQKASASLEKTLGLSMEVVPDGG